MKREIRKYFVSLLILFTLLFSSCLETHVTNKVNADGSIHRTVTIKSDDKEDFQFFDYSVPVDSTWSMVMNYELDTLANTEEGTTRYDTIWVVTYTKDFSDVEELNSSYDRDSGVFQQVNRVVRFQKKFQWFYSRVIFSEECAPLLNGVAPKDFFTEEELKVFYQSDSQLEEYIMHSDSIERKQFVADVEEKSDQWMMTCFVEDFFGRLVAYTEQNTTQLTKEELLPYRDNFHTILDTEDDLSKIIETIFDKKPEVLFGDEITAYLAQLELEYEQIFNLSGHGYTIDFIMPGTLVETNGVVMEDEKVRWDVDSERFISERYIMMAESRVINLWAWFVSAVFIVFVFSGVLFRKR